MKENKIWGETKLIWIGNNTEIHRIIIKKGGYCSKHTHRNKFNLFYVERGKLLIETWKNIDFINKKSLQEEAMIEKTILHVGENTIIKPNQYHRFTAFEPTEALEVYWVNLEEDDIIREDCGGVIKALPIIKKS